ncbi:MAG: peptide chain release factor N(5)-glutamine methyltransferase, partial [Comamonas sp.]
PLALLIGALLWRRKALYGKLNKVHQDIGHFKRDSQWHTPQAILINILLAMPVALGLALCGLALQIDARVLDPRPDTETLVDWALEVLADWNAPRIVDLGTGSGAIALALQRQRPDASVWAVDASADALAVARDNAQRLGLNLQFAQGSWLRALAPDQQFDAIVTNPPYICADDPHLAALTHEPLCALASGADGLDDIRAIIEQSPAHLAPGGWLLIEHGWDQAPAVQELLRGAGFGAVQSRNDLAGIARCTGGCMTDLNRQ